MVGSLGGYHLHPARPRHLLRLSTGGAVRMLTNALPPSRPQRYHHLPNMSQSPTSSSKNPATTASSSNFKVIFEKALNVYKIKTKQDLTTHPLASQLQACDSPAAILTILQDQVHQFERCRSGDERLRRWLNPTINVLYAFSATLGEGIGLVHIN